MSQRDDGRALDVVLRPVPRTVLPPVRRALLIVNPASRRGARWLEPATAELRRHGVTVDVGLTRGPGDAAELARTETADGSYDAVFTLGGDGTAIEVVGALRQTDIPVGVLPGGTGNLLARALGTPMGIRRAVRALLAGDVTRIDLGRLADGRYFAIGVGFGIDARMIANASPRWKRRLGILAYIITGMMAVLRRTPCEVHITTDGVSYTRRASAVLVANIGTLLNGLVTLGPGIGAADGVLNICLFDPTSLWDALRITRKLVMRDFRPDPAMAYYHGTSITLASTPLQAAQADGELLGAFPVHVVAEPSAGCIIVPRRGLI